MSVSHDALSLVVSGDANGQFVHTDPFPTAGTSNVYVAASCFAFKGAGRIDMWLEGSDDGENWIFVAANPPSNALLSWTQEDAQYMLIGRNGVPPYNLGIASRWVRFALRVGSGLEVTGKFSISTNAF